MNQWFVYFMLAEQNRLSRHSGMDYRNPEFRDESKLAIHGTGYPLPAGMTSLSKSSKVE